MSKICTKCGEEKAFGEFYSNKSKKDGLDGVCKPCKRGNNSASYQRTKENHLKRTRAWRAAHKDKVAAYSRAQRERNPEKTKATSRRSYLRKPHYFVAKNAERRARIMQQTIRLNESDSQYMIDIYKHSRALTKSTGVKHEVDHIVPLAGKIVCGLHVPWNVEIKTRAANRRKSSKFEVE